MKKSKDYYLFLCTLTAIAFHIISFPQNTSPAYLDSIVSKFELDLKLKNIDTICIYKSYHVGAVYSWSRTEDECGYEEIFIDTYILWIHENKTYLTIKDNCFDYSNEEINPDSLWYKLFLWKNKIKKEKIKHFEYLHFEKGKIKPRMVITAHFKQQTFKITIGRDSIIKSFNSFDLQEFAGNRIDSNINYLHNNSLKSKRIVDELDKLTSKCVSKNTLTKTRRK